MDAPISFRRFLVAPLTVALAVTTVPRRVAGVLTGAELLLERVQPLVLDLEQTQRRIDAAVTEVIEVARSAGAATEESAEVARAAALVTEQSAEVATAAGATTAEVAKVTLAAAKVTRRMEALLAAYEPVLKEASPAMDELSRLLEPHHARALVQAVQMLPDLIRPAVPAMQALAQLMPELEQLTERLDGVGQVVEGIPGAKMLRRRANQDDDD
jgi:uncharacterized protein YoxC